MNISRDDNLLWTVPESKKSRTPPLIALLSRSARIKLPAVGRVDGWMLLGPLSWGVSLWPHRSGQTRQRPGSVTGAARLVRRGAPVGIYGPAVLNTTVSGSRIISTLECSRLLLRYLSIFLTISQRTADWQMTKCLRNGYWADSCRETDRRLLISLKRLWVRQRWHLRRTAASLSHLSLKELFALLLRDSWDVWYLSHTCLLNMKDELGAG